MKNNQKFLSLYSYFCLSIFVFLLFTAGNMILQNDNIFLALIFLITGAFGTLLSIFMNKKIIWAYKSLLWLIFISWVTLIFSIFMLNSVEPFGLFFLGSFIATILFTTNLIALKKLKTADTNYESNLALQTKATNEEKEIIKVKLLSNIYIGLVVIVSIIFIVYLIKTFSPHRFGTGFGAIDTILGPLILMVLMFAVFFVLSVIFTILLNLRIKDLINLIFNIEFCIRMNWRISILLLISSLIFIFISNSNKDLLLACAALPIMIGNIPLLILKFYKSK